MLLMGESIKFNIFVYVIFRTRSIKFVSNYWIVFELSPYLLKPINMDQIISFYHILELLSQKATKAVFGFQKTKNIISIYSNSMHTKRNFMWILLWNYIRLDIKSQSKTSIQQENTKYVPIINLCFSRFDMCARFVVDQLQFFYSFSHMIIPCLSLKSYFPNFPTWP